MQSAQSRAASSASPTFNTMTTIGTYRHLGQCSTPDGHFTVLAIDHRRNLWESLERHTPHPLTEADFVAFKRAVIEALAPYASAVLTDPQYGYAPALLAGYLPAAVGLLMPLEVTDYSLHPSHRAFRPIPDWSVEKIKRAGGAGVKLLLYYHPEAENAAAQREVVARTVDACRARDIPLFLEPIAFSPDPTRRLSEDEHRQVVIESARLFCGMGISVLKAEFPVLVGTQPDEAAWRDALAELDRACAAHHVPWTLLSGGVNYATFKRQVELACEAGASGVIVGRAVWAEAVELGGEAREAFLRITASERMRQLSAICARSARSWRTRTPPPPLTGEWWRER